jgi:hypothetical protein
MPIAVAQSRAINGENPASQQFVLSESMTVFLPKVTQALDV